MGKLALYTRCYDDRMSGYSMQKSPKEAKSELTPDLDNLLERIISGKESYGLRNARRLSKTR